MTLPANHKTEDKTKNKTESAATHRATNQAVPRRGERASFQTETLPVSPAAVAKAAAILQSGGLVALPTETVYGLAANALDEAAVDGIFRVKGRPQDNPLIAHIADLNDLHSLVKEVPPAAETLAEAFWPGPLTLVLPSSGKAAKNVSAGLGTVAVRVPASAVARDVIRAAGFPLAMPSANRSGSPSPTSAAHVGADFNGKIPLILDDGFSAVGVESTVLSLAGEPTILRPGFVTKEELEETLGQPVALAKAVERPLADGEAPMSPGMKYRHYAPRCALTLLDGTFAAFEKYVADYAKTQKEAQESSRVFALCFAGEEEQLKRLPGLCGAIAYGWEGDAPSQAAGLFAALRMLDEIGAETAFARMPEKTGVGLAVYNRLLRAAAFKVKQL